MKKIKNVAYYGINFIVLILTTIFFLRKYETASILFESESCLTIAVLIASVIMVHFIKALRLYFALYGNGIKLRKHLKIYCKVTPVSMVFPFKIGEFFRMYCYGRELANIVKSMVIILLDRFMDTLALLVVIFITIFFMDGQFNILAVLLMAFLLLGILIYFLFPGFYYFWKKYLLYADASEHKIWALKTLENFRMIHKEVEQVINGRGIVLFSFSLIAWIVEISSLLLTNKILSRNADYVAVMGYLMSAITDGNSANLNRFVFVSVVVLLVGYLVLKASDVISRKEALR